MVTRKFEFDYSKLQKKKKS